MFHQNSFLLFYRKIHVSSKFISLLYHIYCVLLSVYPVLTFMAALCYAEYMSWAKTH